MTRLFKNKHRFHFLPWLILICMWLFVGTQKTKAQEKTAGGTWSLQDCITHGQKNNITIMQNQLSIQTSENNFNQSKLSRYPSLNANGSQNLNFGRSVDPFTNQFVTQQVNSNNFALQASLPLDSRDLQSESSSDEEF
jgi:outer membrane protein